MNYFEVAVQHNKVFVRKKGDSKKCISLSDNNYSLLIEENNNGNEEFFTDFECVGILGCYKLSRSIFIAFITEVVSIGNGISGNPVYQIKDVHFVKLPIIGDNPVNTHYISMIQNVLSVTNLYYSNNEDLSKRLQMTECKSLSEEDRQFPTTMDAEFMFNYPIIQDFAPYKQFLFKDLIPITIFGYMKIIPFVSVDQTAFAITLISRRSIYRNGRRFNTRGGDSTGHVANFVETEQIVKCKDGRVFSHVQIRGSIPLEWSQIPYMKYTPKIHVTSNRDYLSVHFDQLVRKYGQIIVVNLIDKKKDQLLIGEEYERGCLQYNTLKNVLQYNWFDFHAECKGMHYENIDKLLHATQEHVTNAGFFAMDCKTGVVTKRQTGVLRTNCIDCLDRTNVVQSEYAKHALFTQLFPERALVEVLSPSDKTAKRDIFTVFNNLWSDNADQMSLFYSSSRSLKTDFTRTGQRTSMGAVQDGVNSIIRYFNNNFCDGYFEDCLNLTFNQVEMGSHTDKLAKKQVSCTFGQFITMMVLPVVALLYVVCSILCKQPRQVCSVLVFGYLLVLFYVFVKKGVTFGRYFVSKAVLPKKEL